MKSSPVLLLLGAGKNIGLHTANLFAKNGYKVALASRSGLPLSETKNDFLNIKADFADPSSLTTVFSEVESKLGVPSVVVYNGIYSNPHVPSIKTVNIILTTNSIRLHIHPRTSLPARLRLPKFHDRQHHLRLRSAQSRCSGILYTLSGCHQNFHLHR